jgi:hypothetical protein
MPYLDKNGKPVLFEETDYFNGLKKALIYYPVKGKRISTSPPVPVSPTPTPSITPSITVTPTITPTPSITLTPTPTPSAVTYHIEAQNGDLITTQSGDFIDWFPL